MSAKKGFLLIELMIGIALSFIMLLMIAHYIIQVKKVQQVAMMRIEALSFLRNITEKLIAAKTIDQQFSKHDMYHIDAQQIAVPILGAHHNTSFTINKIIVSYMMPHHKKSSLHVYVPVHTKEKDE